MVPARTSATCSLTSGLVQNDKHSILLTIITEKHERKYSKLPVSWFSFVLSEKDHNQAITFYTEAINLNPFVAAYYGNRSFAYLRTECFGYALADANKALELDKTYIKVCFGALSRESVAAF